MQGELGKSGRDKPRSPFNFINYALIVKNVWGRDASQQSAMLCMDVRLLVGPKMGQLRGGDVVLNLVRPGLNNIGGMEVGFVLVVFGEKKTAWLIPPPCP